MGAPPRHPRDLLPPFLARHCPDPRLAAQRSGQGGSGLSTRHQGRLGRGVTRCHPPNRIA